MKTEETLDSIHSRLTGLMIFQIFTAFTRVLLAIGFIPPSITKILNQPFTVLPITNPVGYYFDALYQTGFYYQFIGWSQLIAAILLLFPRTAHFGALMFFPIILNIAVLTSSVGFAGTWLITILMTLAALWLVCWEFDRLKPILFRRRLYTVRGFGISFLTIPAFFGLGGIGLFILLRITSSGNSGGIGFIRLLILVSIGILFGLAVWLHYRFMKVGQLDSNIEKL